MLTAIANFILSRKMHSHGGVLVPDAEAGFNLACDMLSHELRKLADQSKSDILAGLSISRDESSRG